MEQIILVIPVILLSLAVHEFFHGWAADRLGDPTPRAHGRLTLNPISHLDPIGALVLLVTQRFGWAKPVPINPRNFRNPIRDVMVVSVAGPASNVVLAFIFSVVLRIVDMAIRGGTLTLMPGSTTYYLVIMINIGINLNLALAIFNLLPIPPLDGSKILRGLIPYRYYHILDFLEGPQGFLIIILLLFTGILGGILLPMVQFIRNIFLWGL